MCARSYIEINGFFPTGKDWERILNFLQWKANQNISICADLYVISMK